MRSILKLPQRQRETYRFLPPSAFKVGLRPYSVLSVGLRQKRQRVSKMILKKKAVKPLMQQADTASAAQ